MKLTNLNDLIAEGGDNSVLMAVADHNNSIAYNLQSIPVLMRNIRDSVPMEDAFIVEAVIDLCEGYISELKGLSKQLVERCQTIPAHDMNGASNA